MLNQMYRRYDGSMQAYPLTPDEVSYDKNREDIDILRRKIGEMPMALFKASEFIWFLNFVNYCPPKGNSEWLFNNLTGLLTRLQERHKT